MNIVDLASNDAVKVDVVAGLVGRLRPDVVEGGGANHHFSSPRLMSGMRGPANGAGVTVFFTVILASLSYAVWKKKLYHMCHKSFEHLDM